MKEVLENDPEAYYCKEELLENLLVMHKSLEDTKDNSIANGKLLDVIRQVSLMGCPLNLPCLVYDLLSPPCTRRADETEAGVTV